MRARVAAAGAVGLAAAVATSTACGGDGARADGRADTATVLSQQIAESTFVGQGPDSLTTDSAGGATGADPIATGPAFVLVADSITGDVLFHGKAGCLTCHGLNGAGVEGLGPALTDSSWLQGDGSLAAIREVIVRGVATPVAGAAPMPAYGTRLTELETFRIAAYTYSISHPGATVRDTSLVFDTATVRDTIR